VFTPSNASWLNWIEAEFTALRYFTLDGSDYPSHAAQEAAIAGYIRWANRRAKPKRRFAVDSNCGPGRAIGARSALVPGSRPRAPSTARA
jgi:hypothetical protein